VDVLHTEVDYVGRTDFEERVIVVVVVVVMKGMTMTVRHCLIEKLTVISLLNKFTASCGTQ
jgi:predicted membrane-bound mannosyltransferase